MALKITKIKKTAPPPATKSTSKKTPAKAAPKQAAPAEKKAAPTGWFKTGAAVADAVKKEEKRIEKRIEESKKMWRFHLKDGEEATITFVDGNMAPNGVLDAFTYREHTMNINGTWNNHFVCTSDSEHQCPICDSGDDPSLVHVMTVIDHTPKKGKKGIYKDMPRLFVAKHKTFQTLQSLAAISKGLAGCTFKVKRVGESAANVGNEFNFIEKNPIKVLAKKYLKKITEGKRKGQTIDIFVPPNYQEEITYQTAAELRKQGFGPKSAIGNEQGLEEGSEASDEVDDNLG